MINKLGQIYATITPTGPLYPDVTFGYSNDASPAEIISMAAHALRSKGHHGASRTFTQEALALHGSGELARTIRKYVEVV